MGTSSILKEKKLQQVVRRIKPGEDIMYLLLIKVPGSDETFWEIITGREEAYNFIKDNIAEIDPNQSYIVASNTEINLDNLHTVYDFVIFVKNKNNIVDEFDIDDYTYESSNGFENIGVGLESAGQVFTGIAGTFEEADNNTEE